MMDVADLEEAFRCNYADVVAFCRRRLPSAEVDDAVAEVFAILWRRAADVDDEAVRPWLFVAEVDLVAAAALLLSDSDRELLELISWEGLDAVELAAVLNCEVSTMHVRIHRLRSRLRTHLIDLSEPPARNRDRDNRVESDPMTQPLPVRIG